MFDDALLESSPRQTAVLSRIDYLLSTLAGTIVFASAVSLLRSVFPRMDQRALLIAAAISAAIAGTHALMLCYVWADSRKQKVPVWPWLGLSLVLSLPGFLIYLFYSAWKSGDWRRATMPLAYIADSVLVGALVLVPLIYTQALPEQLLIGEIHISPPPGPPRVRGAAQRTRPQPHAMVDLTTAPATIPSGIKPVIDVVRSDEHAESTGPWVMGAPPGGSDGSPGNWVIGSLLDGKQPPPPSVGPAAPRTRIVHLGGRVIAARALYQPHPLYPPLAITARIQGKVVLQAVIGTDGTIQNLKVLSGHPLLVPAAIDAVRNWRYQPTLLNSEPVEVLTEIDVNFTLAQ